MDEVLQRLEQTDWSYAESDPVALAELARRIAAIGRTERFLSYVQRVDRVTFRLPNVADGEPFQIRDWNGLNRAIIGSFLGRIVVDSYRRGRFFASALVIRSEGDGPGEGFFTLARDVRILRANSEDARLQFWLDHVRLARAWHRANPNAEYADE